MTAESFNLLCYVRLTDGPLRRNFVYFEIVVFRLIQCVH